MANSKTGYYPYADRYGALRGMPEKGRPRAESGPASSMVRAVAPYSCLPP